MLHFNGFGRTVQVIAPYKKETRKGQNGEFEVEEVLVKLAFDRGYKVTGKDGNKEKVADFMLCKFTGALAASVNEYALAVDEQGKLKNSRGMYVEGRVETYPKDRKYSKTHSVNLNGEDYDVLIEDTLPDTGFILIVDRYEFTSGNPDKSETKPASGAKATIVGKSQAQQAPASDENGNECPI